MIPRRLSFSDAMPSAPPPETDDLAAPASPPAPDTFRSRAEHDPGPQAPTNALRRPGSGYAPASPTIESRLEHWARSGNPPSQVVNRQAARSQILMAIADGRTTLNLSRQNLGTLPDCLGELRTLENLNVSENELTALPSLPPHLTHLSATDNSLASLPALPAGLTHLDISGNGFRSLPAALPAGLVELNAAFNSLEQLPIQLPQTLEILSIVGNRLTHLPSELPPGLTNLYCHNNPLVTIPYSVFSMRSVDAEVYLSSATLGQAGQQRLREYLQIRLSGQFIGPMIYSVDTEDAQGPLENNIALAARWLAGATLDERATQEPGRVAAWQSMLNGMTSDPNAVLQATGFAEFLGKLAAPSNERLLEPLRARTDTVLTQLQQDDELRALCMNIASEYSTSCGDAAIVGLIAMELAVITSDVKHGRKTLPQVVELGKQFMRLDALDAFATTLGQSNNPEYLELNLWLRTNLAERLDLPINNREMLHADFAEGSFKLDGSTLDRAVAYVNSISASTQKNIDYLVDWQPWHKTLELAYPAEFTTDAGTRAVQRDAIGERMNKLFDFRETMTSNAYREQADQLGIERKALENTSRALLARLTEKELREHPQ